MSWSLGLLSDATDVTDVRPSNTGDAFAGPRSGVKGGGLGRSKWHLRSSKRFFMRTRMREDCFASSERSLTRLNKTNSRTWPFHSGASKKLSIVDMNAHNDSNVS